MATDTPKVVLNPDPLPEPPDAGWGTERYPDGAVFILPTEVMVPIPGVHLECRCAEMVIGRRRFDDAELIDFALRHQTSCGFPADEVRRELGYVVG